MKRLAARVGDNHMCPRAGTGGPHVGGPLGPEGANKVFIGGKRAGRARDEAVCVAAVDFVKKGAPQVLIEGRQAARKGDPTSHGGCVMEGLSTVIIGGAVPPTTDAETIEDAINIIRVSDFGQTPEGRNVVARLEEAQKDGRIGYKKFDNPDQLGGY